MSEYENQMERFDKGMDAPDEVIDAHSLARLTADDGSSDKFYFLTRDGRCVLVQIEDEV